MSITPSKQTSVYRQVDAILKTEDIYGGRQVPFPVKNGDVQGRNVWGKMSGEVVGEGVGEKGMSGSRKSIHID